MGRSYLHPGSVTRQRLLLNLLLSVATCAMRNDKTSGESSETIVLKTASTNKRIGRYNEKIWNVLRSVARAGAVDCSNNVSGRKRLNAQIVQDERCAIGSFRYNLTEKTRGTVGQKEKAMIIENTLSGLCDQHLDRFIQLLACRMSTDKTWEYCEKMESRRLLRGALVDACRRTRSRQTDPKLQKEMLEDIVGHEEFYPRLVRFLTKVHNSAYDDWWASLKLNPNVQPAKRYCDELNRILRRILGGNTCSGCTCRAWTFSVGEQLGVDITVCSGHRKRFVEGLRSAIHANTFGKFREKAKRLLGKQESRL